MSRKRWTLALLLTGLLAAVPAASGQPVETRSDWWNDPLVPEPGDSIEYELIPDDDDGVRLESGDWSQDPWLDWQPTGAWDVTDYGFDEGYWTDEGWYSDQGAFGDWWDMG